MRHHKQRLNVRVSEEQYLKPGYWYNPVNEESFLKMRDLGKSVVCQYYKMYSPEIILDLLIYGEDIWVSNFVEGWWENTKSWKQEDYDRMINSFFQGFKQGFCELLKYGRILKLDRYGTKKN